MEKAFICLKFWHIEDWVFLVEFQKLVTTMCMHTHSVPACRNAFLFIYSTCIRHAYTLSYYRKTQAATGKLLCRDAVDTPSTWLSLINISNVFRSG